MERQDKRFRKYFEMMIDMWGYTFQDRQGCVCFRNYPTQAEYDIMVQTFKAMPEEEKNNFNF
jgi:hypothetical protein